MINAVSLCSKFSNPFPLLKESTHPQCESTHGSCHDRLAYVSSFALNMFLFIYTNDFYNPRFCHLLISQTEYSKPHRQLIDSFSSSFFQNAVCWSRNNGWTCFCIQWIWHSDRFFKRCLRNKWMDQWTKSFLLWRTIVPLCCRLPFGKRCSTLLFIFLTVSSIHL